MNKPLKLTKRHVGLPVKFNAFDGRTYYGTLVSLRNRVASVRYDLTNDCGLVIRQCDAYVPELSRVTLY